MNAKRWPGPVAVKTSINFVVLLLHSNSVGPAFRVYFGQYFKIMLPLHVCFITNQAGVKTSHDVESKQCTPLLDLRKAIRVS